MGDLTGKTVLVTGAGRGLGKGIARWMAKAGANVVLTGRTPETLEASAAGVRAEGVEALVIPGDLTNPEHIANLVARSLDRFGYLDAWVNNAGSADPRDVGPLIDLTPDRWDRVVDLNLKWTFFACQAAARAMTRGGAILNISSRSGSQPNPNTGQYGASKAGLENLTMTMAVEWGHRQIRVNAVAPGLIPTEVSLAPGGSMSRASRRARQVETIPLQRLGRIDDIGPLCVFLVSDGASWITGQVIQLNGGSHVPIGYLTYLHHRNREVAERLAAEPD
jgi:NAD(P)-dependent dehydrogenase (short-subunit alcohol dehydrogenase family)